MTMATIFHSDFLANKHSNFVGLERDIMTSLHNLVNANTLVTHR